MFWVFVISGIMETKMEIIFGLDAGILKGLGI